MVISVAVVEDDAAAAKALCAYAEKYFRSHGKRANVESFSSGTAFLNGRQKSYFDIVFMDIELPDIDGMRVSEEIRKEDRTMVIIFVTNMAQFAVKGYKVDALDFILKPASYDSLALVLDRALERVERRSGPELTVKTLAGVVRIRTCDVKFIEVTNHRLIYHTVGGDVVTYGQIKNVMEQLETSGFVQITRYYVVNLAYVRSIEDCTVDVDGTKLLMSYRKRKEILTAIADYCGGGA